MVQMRRNYQKLQVALTACAQKNGHAVKLLAVSKMQPSEQILACAQLGQTAFGENYVQEAIEKIQALASHMLEWHLIGPLQSNKCKQAAEHFDWIQTVDREKIVKGLSQHRPKHLTALNVLIQVNIDGEAAKSGCHPDHIANLAKSIVNCPNLCLRGLMAIPDASHSQNGLAFTRMQKLFEQLQSNYPKLDTLSMGMSDDFPLAIAHGANLVRIGSALFGPRPVKKEYS